MGNFSFSNITRHSIILVAAGLSFIAMGISIMNYDSNGSRWEALVVARNVMSLYNWGLTFMIVGGLVVTFAHWPKIARTWGYTFLTGLCAAWGMFYLMGAIITKHYSSDLSQAFVWGVQGFIWWSISGLPDVAASRKVKMPLWTGLRKSD